MEHTTLTKWFTGLLQVSTTWCSTETPIFILCVLPKGNSSGIMKTFYVLIRHDHCLKTGSSLSFSFVEPRKRKAWLCSFLKPVFALLFLFHILLYVKFFFSPPACLPCVFKHLGPALNSQWPIVKIMWSISGLCDPHLLLKWYYQPPTAGPDPIQYLNCINCSI